MIRSSMPYTLGQISFGTGIVEPKYDRAFQTLASTLTKSEAEEFQQLIEQKVPATHKVLIDPIEWEWWSGRNHQMLEKNPALKKAVQEDSFCMFDNHKLMPPHLKHVVDKHLRENEYEIRSYEGCESLLKDVQQIGFTFDYYLDAEPYELRPIGF